MELGILNVGAGDTKLSFDPSKPAEVKRAAKAVKEMLRKGFAIFIEAGRDERGPLYRRATDFDEKTAEYIIVGAPDDEEEGNVQRTPTSPRRRKAAKAATRRVPASKARGVAVARVAGG